MTEKDLTRKVNQEYIKAYIGKLQYNDSTKKYGIYNFGQGLFGPVPAAFVELPPNKQPVALGIPIPDGYKIYYEPKTNMYYYVEY